MIVADTNIIVYLVVPSVTTAKARELLRRDQWIAPPLWRHELLNALSLYVRKGLMTLDEAETLVEKAERSVLTSDFPLELRRVLELSQRSGCATYDCEFVALAQHLHLPLITADAKVLKTFPTIAASMDAYLAQP